MLLRDHTGEVVCFGHVDGGFDVVTPVFLQRLVLLRKDSGSSTVQELHLRFWKSTVHLADQPQRVRRGWSREEAGLWRRTCSNTVNGRMSKGGVASGRAEGERGAAGGTYSLVTPMTLNTCGRTQNVSGTLLRLSVRTPTDSSE